MRSAVVRSLIATLVVALVPTAPVAAQTPSLSPHAPILVEGDSDLCNDADVHEGVDVPDGIVNCATADGSAERPYVIAGWNVTWDPVGPCRIQPGALCPTLPPCSFSSVPAAIAVCGTRKHLLLDNLAVGNSEALRQLATDSTGNTPAAALLLSNVDNVEVADSDLSAAGWALYAEKGKTVPTLPAPTNPVRLVRVTSQTWADPASVAGDPDIGLVGILGLNATLRSVTIDASLRSLGVALGGTEEAANSFELRDSVIGNASSNGLGLQVRDADAVLEHNVFYTNGVGPDVAPETSPPDDLAPFTSSASVESGGVLLDSGQFILRHNRFVLGGPGVFLSSQANVEIRENVFEQPTSSASDIAVVQTVGNCAQSRISYNELPGLFVSNQANACSLDARYNWWDGEPNTRGDVNTNPPLSSPLSGLPKVVLAAPTSGTDVFGKVLLFGTIDVASGYQVERVEVSRSESEWLFAEKNAAGARWNLTWDVTGAPLGPLVLFVRACAQGDDCGLPTEVDLVVIDKPLAPIAVLQAAPRLAHVGEAIVLDGSLSYSPQGRPLIGFQFDLGDGRTTAWTVDPSFEVTYAEAGTYPVTLHVMDTESLVSDNVPQTIVRVRPENAAGGGHNVPGVELGLVMLVLLGATAAGRKR